MAQVDDRSRGGFSPEAKALFSRAEKFHSTTVHANAARWELHDRASNQGAMREAAKLGFTGIEVERERGGLGLGAREKLRVAEILGRSSLSFALGLMASQNVAVRLSTAGSARHRSDLLPGLLAGTRFGAVAPPPQQTPSRGAVARPLTATKNPSGWVLDGEATWIVNAAVSDVFICYADTGSSGDNNDLACFVVRSGQVGFKLGQPYRLLAGAPIGVSGFQLTDYQCLDTDMLVGAGDGWRLADEDRNCERLEVAVLACTAVRSALASAVENLGDTDGIGDPALADAVTSLEAAEALTSAAVDDYCADPTATRTSSLALHAKQFSCNMAEQAIAACLQHLGRSGLMETEATGRLMAECRILSGLAGETVALQEQVLSELAVTHGSTASADATVTLEKSAAEAVSAAEVVDLRERPNGDSLSSWASPEAGAFEAGASDGPAVPPMPPMPPADNQLSAVSSSPEPDQAERSLPPMPPPDLRRAGS